MKDKNYIYNPDKHDITKIKRCLYTSDGVMEINNPVSAVTELTLDGKLTLDQKVQRIIQTTLAKKAAQIQRNSVDDPEDMFDFDVDAEDEMTPFEFAAEAHTIQKLKEDVDVYQNVSEDRQASQSFEEDNVSTTSREGSGTQDQTGDTQENVSDVSTSMGDQA
jgi:hypothetical protein